ncbi:hypothetical protein Tco_0494004 [Tanacetum coccineum]
MIGVWMIGGGKNEVLIGVSEEVIGVLEEVIGLSEFKIGSKLDEERFLKQKAKVEWFDVGDSNSAYFYKTIKSKNQRIRIETILNSDNVEVSGSMVPYVFMKHYEQFLGSDMECANLNVEGMFSKTIPSHIPGNMVWNVTNKEIKDFMFYIGDEKAPGLDGHVYRASVLMIPQVIIDDIHQLILGFLWCNGEFIRGKAKVSWESLTKDNGKHGKQSGIIGIKSSGTRWEAWEAPDRSGNVMDFSIVKAWEAIRNHRNQVEWTFKNIRRSLEEIRDIIMVTVRLKLITFRFKNLESVRLLLRRWKMPNNFRIYGWFSHALYEWSYDADCCLECSK